MNTAILAATAAALFVAPAIQAQEVVPIQAAPASAAIPEIVTSNAVLRAGTPVALRLMEEITTKKKAARVGQRFMMEVSEPVIVNGVTVLPSGTPAWGEITTVRNKGMWGKSGKLDARILYLRHNGRQIRLTGTFDDKGVTGTAGVVGAIALVPIAGFFVTGTSAVLPKGGNVGGFIDEDVVLAFANGGPAPMQVPAAAAPMTVPVAAPTTAVTPAAVAEPETASTPTGG
jgi:hypothetical protein